MAAAPEECEKGNPCPDLNDQLRQLERRIKKATEKAENARKKDKLNDEQKFERIDSALRTLDTLRTLRDELMRSMAARDCIISVPLPSVKEIVERAGSIRESQRAWKRLRTKVRGSAITDPGGVEAPGEDDNAWAKNKERVPQIEPRWDMTKQERKKIKEIGGSECDCGDIKRIAIRKGFLSADPTGHSGPSDAIESITDGGDCDDIESQADLIEAAQQCPPSVQKLVQDMLAAAKQADLMAALQAAIKFLPVPRPG